MTEEPEIPGGVSERKRNNEQKGKARGDDSAISFVFTYPLNFFMNCFRPICWVNSAGPNVGLRNSNPYCKH